MIVKVDKDIPFIKGVLEPYADVEYCKGNEMTASVVKGADALIIRTRTKCDEALLEGSNVRLIATATIGTDHIDLGYCRSNGIEVASVPGCNSGAVMQYVFTALFEVWHKTVFGSGGGGPLTIGVVGVGHVGSKVAGLAKALGFRVLLNDPPKAAEQSVGVRRGEILECDVVPYVSLQRLLAEADVVTLHVPLDDTTRGMADERFFKAMKQGAVFVNSCRGEVVEDEALIKNRSRLSGVILDVWRGEPRINSELLRAADVATPHIAGYSVEGKVNGTEGVIRAFGRFCGIGELENYKIRLSDYSLGEPHRLIYKNASFTDIYEQLQRFFPIMELDRRLRGGATEFERIRSEYKYRNEFTY